LKTDEEFEHWSEDTDKLKATESFPDLDSRAYQYLLSRCELLLRCYPTTLEEDAERLKTSDLSLASKFCIRLRMGEKKLLQEAIALCQEKKAALASSLSA